MYVQLLLKSRQSELPVSLGPTPPCALSHREGLPAPAVQDRKATSPSRFLSWLCLLFSFLESSAHSSGLSVSNPQSSSVVLRVHGTSAGNETSTLAPECQGTFQSTFSVLPEDSTFITLFFSRALTAFLPEAEGHPGTCPPFHPHTKEVMKGCQLRELYFLGGGKGRTCLHPPPTPQARKRRRESVWFQS